MSWLRGRSSLFVGTMLPVWVTFVSVLYLGRTSVAEHRSFAIATSSSTPGYAPVTYTNTGGSGTASATAVTPSYYNTYNSAYHAVGRKKRDVATSYSSSTPGYPPVTQTSATGNGVALASVTNPSYYAQPLLVPYINVLRSAIRNDANQQITQQELPLGLTQETFHAPPPPTIQYFSSVPEFSAPAGIVQSFAPHRRRVIRDARDRLGEIRLVVKSGISPSTCKLDEHADYEPLDSGPAAALQGVASELKRTTRYVRGHHLDQVHDSEYGPPAVGFGSAAGAQAAAAAAPAPTEEYPFSSYAPPPVPQAIYGVPDSSEGADASVLTVSEPHTTYGLPYDDTRRRSDDTHNGHPSFRGSYFRSVFPFPFSSKLGGFHPFSSTLFSSPHPSLRASTFPSRA